MNIEINNERLDEVMSMSLKSGGHEPGDAMCIMEAVAYVAGEPWSDTPECACPVIGAFLRNWNDNLPDGDRDELLRDLIPRLVGTRNTAEVEARRATMAADWMIRTHTPAWLRLANLESQAKLLEALPEITDFAHCPSLMPSLEAVRKDAAAAWAAAGAAAGDTAWDAAWDAARDTAWYAAWDAAWDAARAAAWDAARAAARDAAWDAAWDAARAAAWDAAGAVARAAAWDAAWDAARAAAWDAAWDAARDALNDTKKELQQSAKALVIRMIELSEKGAE